MTQAIVFDTHLHSVDAVFHFGCAASPPSCPKSPMVPKRCAISGICFSIVCALGVSLGAEGRSGKLARWALPYSAHSRQSSVISCGPVPRLPIQPASAPNSPSCNAFVRGACHCAEAPLEQHAHAGRPAELNCNGLRRRPPPPPRTEAAIAVVAVAAVVTGTTAKAVVLLPPKPRRRRPRGGREARQAAWRPRRGGIPRGPAACAHRLVSCVFGV